MKYRLLPILVLFFLIGCVSQGYTYLELRKMGSDYQESRLRWTSGSTMIIRLKPFNEKGFLGVCGYFITDGGTQSLIEESYLAQSIVKIDDLQITGTASFLNEIPKSDTNNQSAACIKTEVPYKDEFKHQRLRIIGPSRITIYL